MESVAPLFGRRLAQARQIAGLSLRGLSEALGGEPSHTMLARYESGQAMPDGGVLSKIATVLKQPADFFFRAYEVEFSKLDFRKKAALSVKERRSIEEKSRDFFARYLEIEERLGIQHDYDPPFKGRTLTEVAEVEGFAAELRDAIHWNLGTDPIPNLHQLLELKGIKVHEVDTDDQGFDGFSGEANGQPIVVLAKWLDRCVPRKRMTLAHELAHVVLPIPKDLPEKKHEELVKPFASAFLMPKESFVRMFGGKRSGVSMGELLELKFYFGVSLQAIMMRAKNLELISPAIYQRFCILASKRGWRSKGGSEPGDERFVRPDDEGQLPETHGRFRQLVFRGVAEGAISSSKGAALLKAPLSELRAGMQESFV